MCHVRSPHQFSRSVLELVTDSMALAVSQSVKVKRRLVVNVMEFTFWWL